MMLRILCSLLLALAVANAQPHPGVQTHRFKALRGMKIENHDGEKLGALKDFVIDAASGRVKFVIVKSDGLGLFAKDRLAPSFCLSLLSVKKNTLSLDVTDTRWSWAPVFRKSDLANLATETKKKEITSFYHIVTDAAISNKHAPVLTQTGRDPVPRPQSADKPILASALLGHDVSDSAGRSLGSVCDVLVDTTSRGEAFVLFTGQPSAKACRFAMALCAIKEIQQGKLTLPVTQAELAAAPAFDWGTAKPGRLYQCN